MLNLNCFFTPSRYVVATTVISLLLSACGSQPTRDAEMAEFQRQRAEQARVDNLNQQLAMHSLGGGASQQRASSDSYRLGAGDLVEVTVLGVPELSREVRIDGNGAIALPLINEVPVGGRTVAEASKMVAERYQESYLQNPQVSVLIKEFSSQRITVLGSVKAPRVYAAQQRIGVLEALALAGGLTESAGRMVYVSDLVTDPETGERVRRNFIISLDELINGSEETMNIVLGDGAVVNVPEAGVVYVEGAVTRPGAYPMRQDTTVLKAVAMAGGLSFEAKGTAIRVLRIADNGMVGEPLSTVNIEHVRESPESDITLRNGDVVVIETSAWKSAVKGVVDTTRGFFGFGYSLN
ncbi:MAG: polysaccharide biosynthesis/export family protein [Pseudomonadales bacterium]